MSVVPIQTSRPLFFAFQGGGALVGHEHGVIDAIHDFNPKRRVIGATGTSAGAVIATAFTEGYVKGGFTNAVDRVGEVLDVMSDSQKRSLGVMPDIVEDFMSAWGVMSAPTMDITRRWMDAAYTLTHHPSRPALSYSPIKQFLQEMEESGRGLDFAAIQKAKKFLLIVNATHVPEGKSPWRATATDEQLFTNVQITPKVLAASGSLPELVPPEYINGKRLLDGGFFSNPHLPTAAKYCVEHGADLVIVRSRPGKAFAPLAKGQDPRSTDEQRAFYNNILDVQLDQIRRDYPQLKGHIAVIEPPELEEQHNHRFLKPELSFDEKDMAERHRKGYGIAKQVISQNPDIFPPPREAPLPEPRARSTKLPAVAGNGSKFVAAHAV